MARQRKYFKEKLEPLVISCTSWAELLRKLDLQPTGGNYRHIQSHVRHFEIDTSHFTGALWSKGKTKHTDSRLLRFSNNAKYSLSQVLIENYPGKVNSRTLKRCVLESGKPYICENGHEPIWMGLPITLHIDHINGICNDNRLENLRFLCPNCHQQTHTWGNKK